MRRLLAITLTTTIMLLGCAGDDDGGGPAAPEAISLPGDALYPEGIALAADGGLLVGSFREGSILRIPPGASAAEPFAAPGAGGLVSTVGLLVDQDRHRLWACSSDPGVSPLTGSSPPGLVAFDLDSGALASRVDLPGGGFCNDIAMDAGGNLYVSDSFAPRILFQREGDHELTTWVTDPAFAGDGFNLNGIAITGGALYTVKYNSGELFRISVEEDGSAGTPQAISLSRPLDLPDGLRADGDDLLVIEGSGRLARIALDSGEVTTLAEGLDGPTSLVVSGRDAWVVEGQLGHLFDPSTGAPHLPFQLVRVAL
jgi:sugar lactone lactonase YvrE